MKNIILLVLLIVLSSCRTVKKSWVQENFAEKSVVKEYLTAQNQLQKAELKEIKESFTSRFNTLSKNEIATTTENENESTTVTGSIEAEDGKEKSVTIGDTKITTNGANVKFETSSSKSSSKELSTKINELTTKIETDRISITNLKSTVNSLISENKVITSQIDQLKQLQSKDVKKSGASFGVYLIIGIVLIVLVLLWWFRKSIPFLNH